MARERFTFEGIEEIEDRIKRSVLEVGYLVVWDRTGKGDERLGRFEMTVADALPYLDLDGDGGEPPEPEDVDEEDSEDEDEGDEDAEERSQLARVAAYPQGRRFDPTPAQIADAACRWMRELAARNTVTDEYRRYRVKIYGLKGSAVIDSGSFLCRNVYFDLHYPPASAPALPAPPTQIPPPTFDQAAMDSAARAIKSLGDFYAQWGSIMLGSVGQLQGVNNAVTARLHRDLQDSRDQVEKLLAALIETRSVETTRSEQREADERTADVRTVLARDAIMQLGNAARAFLATKGLSPEMADVLAMLGGCPELMAVLNDAQVRMLMQNPDNLRALAVSIKQAAAAAQAMSDAMNGANAPASESPQPVAA